MKKIQHIEHAFECKNCKGDAFQKAQIKRGKAPIQRSIASPSFLAKVIYDKFAQYLPLYHLRKEWERCELNTNDKNLSNWVTRAAHDFLLPVYERMKHLMMAKSILHVDETYA